MDEGERDTVDGKIRQLGCGELTVGKKVGQVQRGEGDGSSTDAIHHLICASFQY
jgi:hypothetical protein